MLFTFGRVFRVIDLTIANVASRDSLLRLLNAGAKGSGSKPEFTSGKHAARFPFLSPVENIDACRTRRRSFP
jgi:hypothetical protein